MNNAPAVAMNDTPDLAMNNAPLAETFEERILFLLSQNYQLTSLQQGSSLTCCHPIRQGEALSPIHWRIVLHRPPSLIFSYGWGNTWWDALKDSLADYKKQAQVPVTPTWLSITDFEL